MMTVKPQDSRPRPSRQRSGTACIDCRRRKLRCDGIEPQCGACRDSGLECTATQHVAPRGPKKGHIRNLQTRLVTLEQRLAMQEAKTTSSEIMQFGIEEMATAPLADTTGLVSPPLPISGFHQDPFSFDSSSDLIELCNTSDLGFTSSFSDLLRADLDQLYFERVHHFVPIIHRRQYFTWTKSAGQSRSRRALQGAMWMLGAAFSSQMQALHRSLYLHAIQILENGEATEPDGPHDIEHIQARVLLSVYEFMWLDDRKGWLSSGKCFRLLQYQRLYKIDSTEAEEQRQNSRDKDAWIRAEEQRRVFWMAYCLDRFISVRNDCPLTLTEHVIVTRLPAPDEAFQQGRPVTMVFLSGAMTTTHDPQHSVFTESIVLATILGRALAHKQQSAVEHVYKPVSAHFWQRHDWLVKTLNARVEQSAKDMSQFGHNAGDGMLLFIWTATQTIFLYLDKIVDSMCWQSEEDLNNVMAFEQQAWVAAREIVLLSKSVRQYGNFKIHPFMPFTLTLCAEFLHNHQHLDASSGDYIQGLGDILIEMASVNKSAEDFMTRMVQAQTIIPS